MTVLKSVGWIDILNNNQISSMGSVSNVINRCVYENVQ